MMAMNAGEERPLAGDARLAGSSASARQSVGRPDPLRSRSAALPGGGRLRWGARAARLDEQGREILAFVEGVVLHDYGEHALSDERLRNAAFLIRRFHDATVGSRLAAGEEIVCHNGLGPHNTVFVGDRISRLRNLAALWSFLLPSFIQPRGERVYGS